MFKIFRIINFIFGGLTILIIYRINSLHFSPQEIFFNWVFFIFLLKTFIAKQSFDHWDISVPRNSLHRIMVVYGLSQNGDEAPPFIL